MKILFLGDYSGMHLTLAQHLRSLGHDCVVAGDGSDIMNTGRDIDLRRAPGLFNSVRYLYEMWRLVPRLRGFDVVQIVNPCFMTLRPEKLRYFFNKIRSQNGLTGLTLCGSDPFVVAGSLSGKYLRYSEFNDGDRPSAYALNNPSIIRQWTSPVLTDYTRYVYDNIDFAASALYEYDVLAAPYLAETLRAYIGIPVDTGKIAFIPHKEHDDGRLRILVGIKSHLTEFKGLDRLLRAARTVEARHRDRAVVDVARDLPVVDYLARVARADVIVDQLYSYTPATNALQAMAMGKVVVSGAEPEFYEFVGEKTLHPIINAVPDDKKLLEIFEKIVNLSAAEFSTLGVAGRQFVARHNSVEVVAQRLLQLWERAGK